MGRATWASVFRQVCSCAAMERYLRMDDAELLGAFVTGLDENRCQFFFWMAAGRRGGYPEGYGPSSAADR